ncbi:hypothetical protein ACFZDK_07880 [Streptomyces sp. NPDC007901]|uniref:hypothetical protein n=1 Tax=Streptomyces sp. NPDC007901 TaxID=3364785 RepID=UPI0036E1D6B4
MSGSVSLPPEAAPGTTLPGIPRQRTAPSWAESDPTDELARSIDDFVAAAVHPDEIAALLESDGLSDAQIRERHGVSDSFALAEKLYDRVPRRHPEPDTPPHDPWRTALLPCLLRGILFALPGLAYVLGAPLLAGPPDPLGLPTGTLTLLTGALCGWTWNQGLAHRAYTWLGLGDRTAARRALLLGTPTGALLGTLAALAVSDTPTATAFAAAQSCYLGASSVLLVMGRERALLAALSPMTAGALVALVHPVPEPASLTLLLTSLTAVATLAFVEVAPAVAPRKGRGAVSDRRLPPRGRDQPPRRRTRPTAPSNEPQLINSLPYALFGLATGILVVHAALTDLLTGQPHPTVALTLSMGPAEWLLYRFRSRALTALRTTGTAAAFRRATAGTLAACLTGYLATLLALALTLAALWPHAPDLTPVRLAGLLLLGAVLWTGLLLQSFGAVLAAAAVCCVAALAQTLALLTHTADPHRIAVAVLGAAAVAQTALVRARTGRATAHR